MLDDEGPVERIVRVICGLVPGAPPFEVPPEGPPGHPVVALGRAIDAHAPGFATQPADLTLRALVIAGWADQLGGIAQFADLPAGGRVLATWAALDVVLSLGALDVARTTAAHLEAQRRRLVALGGVDPGPGWVAAVPVLQERVDAAASVAEALKEQIAALLWTREGRLAYRPDTLVFYGRLSAGLVRPG